MAISSRSESASPLSKTCSSSPSLLKAAGIVIDFLSFGFLKKNEINI
jgi:hypothetical protein